MREPLRRALDAILVRWVGLYLLAGTVIACPILCGVGFEHMPWWRAVLPLFLVGFIAVHLLHRTREVRADGWDRAIAADPGSIRLLLLVGFLAMTFIGLCLVSIFWPYEDPFEIVIVTAVGAPILVPLYAVSVWVAIDCATRRLARSADESDRALREYWRALAGR